MTRWISVTGSHRIFDAQAQSLGHALAIRRVTPVAVANMTILDKVWHACHVSGGIIKQDLLLLSTHQMKQRAWLAKVVAVVFAKIIVRRIAINL